MYSVIVKNAIDDLDIFIGNEENRRNFIVQPCFAGNDDDDIVLVFVPLTSGEQPLNNDIIPLCWYAMITCDVTYSLTSVLCAIKCQQWYL